MPDENPTLRALGRGVRARRDELGMTQEELSLKAGLHQRWISNVETGKRNPSYLSLQRLAAGLELTASGLLARAEQLAEARVEPDDAAATSR